MIELVIKHDAVFLHYVPAVPVLHLLPLEQKKYIIGPSLHAKPLGSWPFCLIDYSTIGTRQQRCFTTHHANVREDYVIAYKGILLQQLTSFNVLVPSFCVLYTQSLQPIFPANGWVNSCYKTRNNFPWVIQTSPHFNYYENGAFPHSSDVSLCLPLST